MVRLFDLEAGESAELVIERVGVHRDDGGVMVDRRIRCTAEATDRFEEIAGEVRRLFVHVTPPIDGQHDHVWMMDSFANP